MLARKPLPGIVLSVVCQCPPRGQNEGARLKTAHAIRVLSGSVRIVQLMHDDARHEKCEHMHRLQKMQPMGPVGNSASSGGRGLEALSRCSLLQPEPATPRPTDHMIGVRGDWARGRPVGGPPACQQFYRRRRICPKNQCEKLKSSNLRILDQQPGRLC